MTTARCFSTLPNELSAIVFSYLSPESLSNCVQVSKGFRILAQDSLQQLAPTWPPGDWDTLLRDLATRLGFKKPLDLVQLIYDHPVFQSSKPAHLSTLEYGFQCLNDACNADPGSLRKEEVERILALKVLTEPWQDVMLDDLRGLVDHRGWPLIKEGTDIGDLKDRINQNYLLKLLLHGVSDDRGRLYLSTCTFDLIRRLLSAQCFSAVFDLLSDPEITFDIDEERKCAAEGKFNALYWTASLGQADAFRPHKFNENDEALCISMVDELVKRGADVKQALSRPGNPTYDGETALHAAAFVGSAKMLKCLLRHPSGINQMNSDGYTPLKLAVFWGHEDAVISLLEQGANPNLSGGTTCTPLQSAIKEGYFKIAQHLLRYDAIYQNHWRFTTHNMTDFEIEEAIIAGNKDALAVDELINQQQGIRTNFLQRLYRVLKSVIQTLLNVVVLVLSFFDRECYLYVI